MGLIDEKQEIKYRVILSLESTFVSLRIVDVF
jgi:hypothetical protein